MTCAACGVCLPDGDAASVVGNAAMPRLLPLLLWACFPAFAAGQAPSDSTPGLSPAEYEVWARELGFAQSVADGDAGAFASHLEPGAVFGAKSPQPQRGRDAVVAAWAGLIAGDPIRLQWYPTMVAVGGSGRLAYSSGPALYEKAGAQGPDFRIGAFQSIWRRGDDGAWRVVFDDGIRPQPATPEEVEAFRNGRSVACPRPPR